MSDYNIQNESTLHLIIKPQSFGGIINELITIGIIDQTGKVTPLRIRKTTKMYQVFNSYAGQKGRKRSTLYFLSDREYILGDETPMTMELKDEAQIDCISAQDSTTIIIKEAKTLTFLCRLIIDRDNVEEPTYLFDKYATMMGTTINCVRFTHNRRPLFLSSVENKSASDLGLCRRRLGLQDNEIHAWHIPDGTQQSAESSKPARADATMKRKSNSNASKGNTQTKGKNNISSKPAYFDVDSEKKWKRLHSRAISDVFEEAAPQFKEMRQKLDALNLERTEPKDKSIQRNMNSDSIERIDNAPAEGLGGKAGKTHFEILVGEVDNLYKSQKRSKRRKHKLNVTTTKNITIDLHGMTTDEAQAQLDESLPTWVDIAMHGSYPWVIPVTIVCGGGNQILSELVENWIKQTAKVANARKVCVE